MKACLFLGSCNSAEVIVSILQRCRGYFGRLARGTVYFGRIPMTLKPLKHVVNDYIMSINDDKVNIRPLQSVAFKFQSESHCK